MNIDDLARWEITQREKEMKAIYRMRELSDIEEIVTRVRSSEVNTYYIDENGRRIDESETDDDTER